LAVVKTWCLRRPHRLSYQDITLRGHFFVDWLVLALGQMARQKRAAPGPLLGGWLDIIQTLKWRGSLENRLPGEAKEVEIEFSCGKR